MTPGMRFTLTNWLRSVRLPAPSIPMAELPPPSRVAALLPKAAVLALTASLPQYYAYISIQPPPVVNGHLTSRVDFTRGLNELATSLGAAQEMWRKEGRYPVCVSDGDERSVLGALRNGRIHSLVWCGTGACGWEAKTSPAPVTLEAMISVIHGLAKLPRVAIVCHAYGARKAAEKLHAAGIATVIWLRADVSHELSPIFFNVLAPALAAAHTGSSATDLREAVLTSGRKLFGADWSAAGCFGCRRPYAAVSRAVLATAARSYRHRAQAVRTRLHPRYTLDPIVSTRPNAVRHTRYAPTPMRARYLPTSNRHGTSC